MNGILREMKLIALEALIRENVFTEKAPTAALLVCYNYYFDIVLFAMVDADYCFMTVY
jgi:hypothetical protein